MNETPLRFPRFSKYSPMASLGSMQGPYQRPMGRAARIARAALCLAAFALIGVLLALRG